MSNQSQIEKHFELPLEQQKWIKLNQTTREEFLRRKFIAKAINHDKLIFVCFSAILLIAWGSLRCRHLTQHKFDSSPSSAVRICGSADRLTDFQTITNKFPADSWGFQAWKVLATLQKQSPIYFLWLRAERFISLMPKWRRPYPLKIQPAEIQ